MVTSRIPTRKASQKTLIMSGGVHHGMECHLYLSRKSFGDFGHPRSMMSLTLRPYLPLEVRNHLSRDSISRIELMNSADIVLRSDTIGTRFPNLLRTNC